MFTYTFRFRRMNRKPKNRKLARLKARLVARGITVKDFASENGYSIQTVTAALNGYRAGKKSTSILRHIASL